MMKTTCLCGKKMPFHFLNACAAKVSSATVNGTREKWSVEMHIYGIHFDIISAQYEGAI